jgi:glycosyltransferase involved in cell wall biosynthesis
VIKMSTSVIIPVRNGAQFIAEAVDSALQQLALDDEVIVVDDKSTDMTRLILARMQDRRIHIVNGSGRGVSSARNIGLAAAAGEFIAFLDHDDLWPPQRHSALRQALLADAAVDCAIGRIRLRMEHDAVLLPHVADLDGRLAANLSLCTALFRRRILDQIGAFDEGMQFWEDTDYFLRLQERGYRTVLCDIDALIYRRHRTNTTCNEAGRNDGFMQLVKRRRARIAGRPDSGR